MSEDLNNNVHRRDSAFQGQKPVQEDTVPLGVERVVEGDQMGVNSFYFEGLLRWVKEHAVQSTVAGFVAGYLLGSFLSRNYSDHSMEAL
jgi:hypothetical protein